MKIKINILLCAFLALVLAQAPVEAQTKTFEYYFKRGYDAYQRGEINTALADYQKALELNSNSAELYNELGKVYRDKNAKLSEIVWHFQVALDINPEYLEAYENLGKLYQHAEMYDKSITYFEKALDINPDLLSTQFALAWVYLMGKNQPYDAIHYFNKVIEQNEIPMAYFGLGLAYSRVNDGPRVLDVVTTLKSKGETELARQLEDAIRTPYTPKVEEIQLPSSGPPASSVAPPAPETPPAPPGTMRIRLRGNLYGINDNP